MSDFHIVTPFDPKTNTWLPSELIDGKPLARVRQLLGGNWTSSDGHLVEDMSAAFWNAGNGRKAFVLRLPKGLPRAAAQRVLEAA